MPRSLSACAILLLGLCPASPCLADNWGAQFKNKFDQFFSAQKSDAEKREPGAVRRAFTQSGEALAELVPWKKDTPQQPRTEQITEKSTEESTEKNTEPAANIFSRFALPFRRSEPGSGLGLALVDAIADLHRASFTFEDGRPSEDKTRPGLAARITFPRLRRQKSTHPISPLTSG